MIVLLLSMLTSASGIEATNYIYIDQEEMYVESISGTALTVRRAQDNTTAADHVLWCRSQSYYNY